MRKAVLLTMLGLVCLGLRLLTHDTASSNARFSYSDWDNFQELFH